MWNKLSQWDPKSKEKPSRQNKLFATFGSSSHFLKNGFVALIQNVCVFDKAAFMVRNTLGKG